MALVRSTIETFTQVVTRIRREVGDPSTDLSNNTIPEAARRFSDLLDIFPAINDMLRTMANIVGIKAPQSAIQFQDITYTEAADYSGMALDSDIPGEDVVFVTDVTDPLVPTEIFFLYPQELQQVPAQDTVPVEISRRFYSIMGNTASAPASRILIRPSAVGRVFRLYYLDTPFVSNDTDVPLGDNAPFSARWAQLIGLGAALQLLSPDDEQTVGIATRYAEQMRIFNDFVKAQRQQRRVRMVRRPY